LLYSAARRNVRDAGSLPRVGIRATAKRPRS
jgi:hypothetical protein